MTYHADSIKESYDLVATEYTNKAISEKSMLAELSKNFTDNLRGKDILDIGCGSGEYTSFFEQQNYNVTGIDFSPKMIELTKLQTNNTSLICDSFETHKFTKKFDGLWVCNSLHNMPAKRRANLLWKFVRLLKPEGIIAITLRQGDFEGPISVQGSQRYYCYSTPEEILNLLDGNMIHIKTTENTWLGIKYFTVILKKPNEETFWSKILASVGEKTYRKIKFVKYYASKRVTDEIFMRYLNAGDSSLELGCGSGVMLSLLSKKGVLTTGIDNAKSALKLAEKIAEEENQKVKYIQSDFHKHQGKYDLVFNGGVVEHLSNAECDETILKMISLSNKYISIAVPNIDSPIFKGYIKQLHAQGVIYPLKDKKIDVKHLFKKHKIKLLDEDGYLLLLEDMRFAKQIFPNIPLTYTHEDINKMIHIESNIPKNQRIKYGLMNIYFGEIS